MTGRSRSARRIQRGQGRGPHRSTRVGTLALALACAALALVAVLAPTAPARSSGEGEAGSTRAARQAQREQRLAERRERRSVNQAARRSKRPPRQEFTGKREHVEIKLNCLQIEIAYSGFPAQPGDSVEEQVSIGGVHIVQHRRFTFTGPAGTDTFQFIAPVRETGYQIDIHGKWAIGDFHGTYDIPVKVKCGPEPAYTMQKLQRIGSGAFTTEQLAGQVGQTVEYEILLTNTGNEPLTFEKFEDGQCDAGTIVRSTLEPVQPGAHMTFECLHVLSGEDATKGSYANTATVTGVPPQGTGELPPHESNTVVVTPIAPPEETKKEEPPTEPKKEEPKNPETPKTPEQGTLSSKTTDPNGGSTGSKTGVLGFSVKIPALQGPQGCVRGAFHARIKATGVASVTFYLDGHKLRTLTPRSAHGGLLSVRIDPSRWSIGPHKILAKITMKAASAAARPTRVSRSLTVVHCASSTLSPHFTG